LSGHMMQEAEQAIADAIPKKAFSMLCVDDDANDILLLRKALKAAAFAGSASFVLDGQEAIEWLEDEGSLSPPDLILLDLKMPRRNGFELLQWLRARNEHRAVPVVIFTTSSHSEDIVRAYDLGADLFLVKPLGYGELMKLARALSQTLEESDFSFALLMETSAFRRRL
jgi:DNA-binding response OmpR family regulator